eukprot:908034-Prorocentrum_minimum.AAC.1
MSRSTGESLPPPPPPPPRSACPNHDSHLERLSGTRPPSDWPPDTPDWLDVRREAERPWWKSSWGSGVPSCRAVDIFNSVRGKVPSDLPLEFVVGRATDLAAGLVGERARE